MIGILNVYKPKGMTSHDVVSFMRRKLHMKRIGHTGTLDPLATGVLPILIGNATKLSDLIMADEKKYVAKVTLGITTDTDDATGEILKREKVDVKEETIKEVIKNFIGEIEQIPPMYSAIKVDGRKLYQLARRGEEIERKPRKVTIHSIKISNFDGENFDMEVHCGKGTYIRALCRDIGDALGTGAVMSELERTHTGMFKKENTYTLEEIEKLAESGEIENILMPPDAILGDFERIDVDSEHEAKIKNGIRLRPEQLHIKNYKENDMYRIYSENKFISILKVTDCNGELLLAIEKSFY